MNTIDAIILGFVVIGAATGLFRGFFKELVGTVGFLLAAIVANIASPYGKPFMGQLVEDDTLSYIIIWVVVFILMLFAMNKVAWLLDKFCQKLNIQWINRLAAALLGAVKFVLIAALAVSILEVACAHVEGLKFADTLHESQLVPYLHQVVSVITPWASEHILSPALEILTHTNE